MRLNQATGLLTPFDDGTGSGVRWRLLPRAASEVLLEIKAADLSVTTAFDTTAFDTAAASLGDTVEIMVIARSVLPASTHTATGVSVADTIPAALTFLSATATSGSYASGTGVWDVGDLGPGAADTLRINAEVTGGPAGVTNTARLNPLVLEVEINAANNTGSANLTIS